MQEAEGAKGEAVEASPATMGVASTVEATEAVAHLGVGAVVGALMVAAVPAVAREVETAAVEAEALLLPLLRSSGIRRSRCYRSYTLAS